MDKIKEELGVPKGESPTWDDHDPRWENINPLHDKWDAFADEWSELFDRIERRGRALDRQFAKMTERQAPNLSLLSDWVRSRGYDLSDRDVRKRLLPTI